MLALIGKNNGCPEDYMFGWKDEIVFVVDLDREGRKPGGVLVPFDGYYKRTMNDIYDSTWKLYYFYTAYICVIFSFNYVFY